MSGTGQKSGSGSAAQLKVAAHCPRSVRAKRERSLQVKYCLKLGSYTGDIKTDTVVISVQKQTRRAKRRRKFTVLSLPPLEIPLSAARR